MRNLVLLLSLGSMLVACGGATGGPDADTRTDASVGLDGGADATADAGVDAAIDGDGGLPRPVVGTIRVMESRALGAYPWTEAHVNARLGPGSDWPWHTEVDSAGSCRRLAYLPAFCDPPCEPGTGNCVGDPGGCVPFPTSVDAGAITITGLTGGPSTLTYETYGYYLVPAPPADCFDEGTVIVASLAGGGGFPAMQVTASGVASLESPTITGWQVTVPSAADAVFDWTPSGQAGDRLRVVLRSENQAHGLPLLGVIECDTDDAEGTLVVPGSLLAGFPETTGPEMCVAHDCPPSTMERYDRGAALALEGEVELRVVSQIQFGLVHPAP